jgi:hypothetical protein
VLGEVEAIVEVGVVLAVELLLDPVEPVDDVLEDEEPVPAGEGDTIETGVVELADDGAVDVDAEAVLLEDVDDDPLDDVAAVGFELSLGTPLANGSRAIRASTTLAGSLDGAGVVDVWLVVVAVADGGAGGSVVPPAGALLSSSIGTAAMPTTSSATTIHSLRSIRSRRSELIPGLRSRCRTWSCRRVADRWTR